MRIFLDTSVLVKKYILGEPGAERLGEILHKADAVVVSPITRIEMHHAFSRLSREGLLGQADFKRVVVMLEKDYIHFDVVLFNEQLEKEALRVLEAETLRSGDAIQLAAFKMAKADLFCTADKKLFQASKKFTRSLEFI